MPNNSTPPTQQDELKYALFVYAAYAVFEKYDANQADINPVQKDYPYFPEGYTLLKNIHMNDFFGESETTVYYGFIAQSLSRENELVVAIRGTVGFVEWWDDIHVFGTPSPFGSHTGHVVSGFLDIFNTLQTLSPGTALTESRVFLKDLDLRTLTGASLVQDDIQVTGAGHSLGAALITLYGAQKAATDQPLSAVYTYASPCVGSHEFANYYNRLPLQSVRVFNKPDIVPKVLTLFKYKQVDGGVEINSLNNHSIRKSLGCFHYLATYIYLLGGTIAYAETDGCIKGYGENGDLEVVD